MVSTVLCVAGFVLVSVAVELAIAPWPCRMLLPGFFSQLRKRSNQDIQPTVPYRHG